MTLVRFTQRAQSPGRSLALHNEVDRLFDGLVGSWLPADARNDFFPAVDIDETTEEYVLRVDLPGVAQKDIKVTLVGDLLTVRGERRGQRTEKEGSRLRSERTVGAFERTFGLEGRVRADGVQAVHRDGVLEIHVPKADEAKAREIEVRAS